MYQKESEKKKENPISSIFPYLFLLFLLSPYRINVAVGVFLLLLHFNCTHVALMSSFSWHFSFLVQSFFFSLHIMPCSFFSHLHALHLPLSSNPGNSSRTSVSRPPRLPSLHRRRQVGSDRLSRSPSSSPSFTSVINLISANLDHPAFWTHSLTTTLYVDVRLPSWDVAPTMLLLLRAAPTCRAISRLTSLLGPDLFLLVMFLSSFPLSPHTTCAVR